MKGRATNTALPALTFGLVSWQVYRNGYERAGQLLIKAVLAFVTSDDLQMAADYFVVFYKRAGSDVRSMLKVMWEQVGLSHFPNLL